MTLRDLLDATHATVINEHTSAGVSRADVVEAYEKLLAEPLPDELSPVEMEQLRRQRISEENQKAIDRMTGRASMARGDG